MQNLWQPSASLEMLQRKADLLSQIRDFFAQRQILEVDTPLLCHATTSNPHIMSFSSEVNGKTVYLQTSPEYAMKRLLAAGSGSIYQICKSFRQDISGPIHNPEFLMLEWYRLGFDHHVLMDEVDALLQLVLRTEKAERFTYGDIFQKMVGVNPHRATVPELAATAKEAGVQMEGELDRDGWLNLLMSHCVEPIIGQERPAFVYDFPAIQAALARVRHEEDAVASRFEVYYKGIELGNGFHELQSEAEQRKRFIDDLDYRKKQGLPEVPVDEFLLAALDAGLPDCAGIAVGVDRLVMLALEQNQLKDILSFDFERA